MVIFDNINSQFQVCKISNSAAKRIDDLRSEKKQESSGSGNSPQGRKKKTDLQKVVSKHPIWIVKEWCWGIVISFAESCFFLFFCHGGSNGFDLPCQMLGSLIA
jgi:hypothetical protein